MMMDNVQDLQNGQNAVDQVKNLELTGSGVRVQCLLIARGRRVWARGCSCRLHTFFMEFLRRTIVAAGSAS
jgi:hypothetical protein